MAGLRLKDSGERPALKDSSDESFAPVASPAADVWLIDKVNDGAVTDIKIRVPALGLQIEGVSRQISIVLCRHEGIVDVIDGMRVGIRHLELHAMGNLLLQVHLHAIVNGIANGLGKE